MANHFAPQSIFGWELLLVMGIGAAVIVALAASANRWAVAAAWQAAIWRICTLSLFALVLLELTGLGPAIVQLCRQQVVECKGAGSGRGSRVAGRGERPASAACVASSMTLDAWRPSLTKTPPSQRAAGGAAADGSGQANSTAVATPGFASDAISGGSDERVLVPVEAVDQVQEAGPLTGCLVHSTQLPALPAWSRWLAVIWAIGTVSVLGWFFGGRVAAWFFRRRCAKCDDETILAQIVTLKSELGIRRSVAVLVSSRVAAPVVLGGWPPAVVLPPRFRREFDPQQQETILAHELAHLVWRDPAWQGAALVLCSLLWWHPLVWWSRRQLRAANEALADEASLVVPDGPRVLAEALVLLGQRLVRLQPRFGLSLGGSRFRSGLGRRVERLLALPSRGWRTPRRARLAFAHFSLPVLMALVAIVGTAWVPSSVPLMLGETTMSVFSNAWRGSLVATALCSMLGSVPVTADDQPVKTPSASADREKVEKEFKAMREKVAQLEKDGKHDEAEKLKHQAYEMMSKARASYAGSTSSQPAVSGPEAEKIRGQLKELSQKAAQLEKDGKHDEVEKIRHEARELYSKLNPRGATIAVSVGPEREQLYQQMRALHEKIEKAKQEGKSDDVQRLMKEAEGLRTKIYPQGSYGPGRSSSGDREARLQHLRSAAENLKAAGFDAEAQHVMQMIERIRAEGSREGRSSGETSRPLTELRPSSSSVPPGASIMSSRDYAAGPAVQELRGQIEQMRREMRELREQINQAKGGERK